MLCTECQGYKDSSQLLGRYRLLWRPVRTQNITIDGVGDTESRKESSEKDLQKRL